MASSPRDGDLPPNQPSPLASSSSDDKLSLPASPPSQPSASQPSAGNSPSASNSSDTGFPIDLDHIISSDEETERPCRCTPHFIQWHEEMKELIINIDDTLKIVASWTHIVPEGVRPSWGQRTRALVTAMMLLKLECEHDINHEPPYGRLRRENKHFNLQMKWFEVQDAYLEMKMCVDTFQNILLEIDRTVDGEPLAKRARSSNEHM